MAMFHSYVTYVKLPDGTNPEIPMGIEYDRGTGKIDGPLLKQMQLPSCHNILNLFKY